MAALFSWSPRHFDIHLFVFAPQLPGPGIIEEIFDWVFFCIHSAW